MIRSLLFAIIFWPIFAIYITLMWPIALIAPRKFVFRYVYRVCARYLMWCLRYICRLNYQIEGLENLKKQNGPIIIGCNHQSTWETFIFALILDDLAIVIKKELLNLPIAGLYFRRLGCIPIDRSSPINSIRTLLNGSQKAIDNGLNLLIFPNGTRNIGHSEYKVGIYAIYNRLNVPVIPAHVNSGEYWPANSFKKSPGTITLKFSTPIPQNLPKNEFFRKMEG